MLAAGLIEVTDTRWSAKDRKMKIYAVKGSGCGYCPKEEG